MNKNFVTRKGWYFIKYGMPQILKNRFLMAFLMGKSFSFGKDEGFWKADKNVLAVGCPRMDGYTPKSL